MTSTTPTSGHTAGELLVTLVGGKIIELNSTSGPVPVVSMDGFTDERRSREEHLANAKRLVLAWNAHDALLKACKELQGALLGVDGLASDPTNKDGWTDRELYTVYMRAESALALATGGQP